MQEPKLQPVRATLRKPVRLERDPVTGVYRPIDR
ncbi:hypothetical protein A6302_04258 [Methylobrevis pamukkalensis]|uniref:Uncharacterized protein n=1 Tax=Methylobrevis pamukkalensis TaxID=1439726 RepID=A0A1E3GYN4_9HYPH|nr:hypothetical protein A6302_04258 [Methylobrevis pamukkalensis]